MAIPRHSFEFQILMISRTERELSSSSASECLDWLHRQGVHRALSLAIPFTLLYGKDVMRSPRDALSACLTLRAGCVTRPPPLPCCGCVESSPWVDSQLLIHYPGWVVSRKLLDLSRGLSPCDGCQDAFDW